MLCGPSGLEGRRRSINMEGFIMRLRSMSLATLAVSLLTVGAVYALTEAPAEGGPGANGGGIGRGIRTGGRSSSGKSGVVAGSSGAAGRSMQGEMSSGGAGNGQASSVSRGNAHPSGSVEGSRTPTEGGGARAAGAGPAGRSVTAGTGNRSGGGTAGHGGAPAGGHDSDTSRPQVSTDSGGGETNRTP